MLNLASRLSNACPKAYVSGDEAELALLSANDLMLRALARIEEVAYVAEADKPAKAMSALAGKLTLYVPLEGLVDLDQEVARVEKELAVVLVELKRVQGKLGNEQFIARAPADVVEKERAKLAEFQEQQSKFEERLAQLKG